MKQVIVVNEALRLPRGKLAAQVAHASVAAFLRASAESQERWLSEGMRKIVLSCESAEQLTALMARASERGIAAELICDAGRTVVEAGTATCLGLGPAADSDMDRITGALKLVD
ncbi:MAG TPA: peptidyl-tRNA hydrolase Pth2 [Steroidobacteraceae bacterium]|jgi:peptidyl-tRNA hydrolase|nr:peptidyl-tRNA hydrolase Pth2 [Steroidobacteraceae bacterium]